MVDPLHQFVIKPIFNINVAGLDLSFTNSSCAVLAAVVAMCCLFAFGIRSKMLVPNRIQAACELAYKFIADMIDENIGVRGQKYFPFVFSIFLFVLFGNLIGLIPGMFTFTSHIIATFSLAMVVFCFITILGFVKHGMTFLTLFVPKGVPAFLLPLLVVIELISYLVRPISLSIRLCANMVAGHTMIKIFAGFVAMCGLLGGIVPLSVNAVLTVFEIGIASLQAYIFTILTCIYLNDAIHLH
jgi:F-type H+-transporting ATPase subunit a